MADTSIRNLVTISSSDRLADLFYIVDASQPVGSGDFKVTPQKLMDDTPASGTQAGSMSSADFTKLLGLSNYTDEQAQDAIGGILTDSTSIDFTYNDAAGSITASAIFGASAGTVCQGNDSRLANARTPTSHAASHQSGGGDTIALDTLGAPTDITTLNSSTTAHGLLPKLNNVATNYLDGTGAWSTPAGGGTSFPTTTKGDLIVHNGTTNVRQPVGTNYQSLVADSASSTGLSYARMPYLIHHQNTTITNSAVTGTGDTVIWTYDLPANVMGANGIVHIVAQTRNATNATVGARTGWKVKFGGTTYRQSTTQAASINTTWMFDTYIMNRGATNSQLGSNAGAIANSWNTSSTARSTSTVDTTAAVTLQITFQSIASATDTATIDYVLVYVIPG